MAGIVARLNFVWRSGGDYLVSLRGLGEVTGKFSLPFQGEGERQAVADALEAVNADSLSGNKRVRVLAALTMLGLADSRGFTGDLPRQVGGILFDSLFADDRVRVELREILDRASEDQPVRLELELDARQPELSAYPWELLYDTGRGKFLFSNRVTSLVRYLKYGAPATELIPMDQLRLLVVDSRPDDPALVDLIDSDVPIIRDSLRKVLQAGNVQVERLDRASNRASTWDQLNRYLVQSTQVHRPHILHFDGHGDFGLLCDACGHLNPKSAEQCRGRIEGKTCDRPLQGQAQGYLAFEDKSKQVEWIRADKLANLLSDRGIRLVVLSACRSAQAGGDSAFNGVAQALIQHGIPAVVAMQYAISEWQSEEFARIFYLALAQGQPLTECVGQARAALFLEETAWYRPVLYLRSDENNMEGRLFKIQSGDVSLPKSAPELAISGTAEAPIRLRLTQEITAADQFRVAIEYWNRNGARLTARSQFDLQLIAQDRLDLRWYLEDYLQYPMDPAPQIARRVEERMSQLGVELFQKIFQDQEARDLWATVRGALDDARVEVATDVHGATALPWELLRDPQTDAVLALSARDFVHTYSGAAQRAERPQAADKVRILLVICRPGGGGDVPFRSVASRLIKGLSEEARQHFELEVLRPPTFEQLAQTLRDAKRDSRPYHIVHFDGHGAYLDLKTTVAAGTAGDPRPYTYAGLSSGSHGYLVFENPSADGNLEYVGGTQLGQLLVQTDVPVLVLNACRSAHAEPLEAPDPEQGNDDPHNQVRAFGSLAQEVMDAGAAGVVAMRYNVYVVTAAQFVAELYAALASGMTLGEAASRGRKQLAAQPLRTIAFEPIQLQDWPVPVVYEAAPVRLFPASAATGVGRGSAPMITLSLSQPSRPQDDLPRPEVGFFGRDETLLALDRAFDTQKVVLLHAYAGSGKTMTAAEFARWYLQTGGLEGPVLYTAFTEYKPLSQVLSAVEEAFRSLLEENNIQWGALDTQDRVNITGQIFRQTPVLWIWDNIEPVAGFPSGTSSAWTEAEQKELKSFLDNLAAMTKAKFLLTSRRDEQGWLGELPARVQMPPMPFQERVQLAAALAAKRGRALGVVEDWRPLLEFTRGNPLTLTVLVGQALSKGLKTKAEVLAHVERLRAGEAAFTDDESEGRSKSLGASLKYGFEHAFTEDERKVLALLHFFQGFVDVDALRIMVNPTSGDWGLGGFKDFGREHGIALLDRAAEIGLLETRGGGYFTIHPALPWFFNEYYTQYYGQRSAEAEHAFVETMGELGSYYNSEYESGNREVIEALRAEEANLLHARRLALRQARRAAQDGQPGVGWWGAVIHTMAGLYQLYGHTGRRAEWQRLVEEITPDFVGTDDLPLPGREGQWSRVTEYRVHLARDEHRWKDAERLQTVCVDWDRRNAAAALALPSGELRADDKNAIRTLAVSLGLLGIILMAQGNADCVSHYREDYDLVLAIDDFPGAAIAAYNLGIAYQKLPALQNLDEAERWYHRSLKLFDESDWKGRSGCIHQLGSLAYERFKIGHRTAATESELLEHLKTAAGYYHQALKLTPPDAADDLAVTHDQLGVIYEEAHNLEQAQHHYTQSIHYYEIAGNHYGAGETRYNLAIALTDAGLLDHALLYARAALLNFEPYGQGAAKRIQRVKELIAEIELRYAAALGDANRFDEALEYARDALRIYEALGSVQELQTTQRLIAEIEQLMRAGG